MPRHPTQPSEAIAIPHDSWFKLYTGRLQDMDNPKELWEVAVEAIDEWTRRHHPDGFTQVTHVGYQWKHLFLPPGTLLRTIFRGKNYHCLVEAEHLLYEGKPVSPNVFVNAVGGIRRNAWRSIWVLYPNTTEWKLADTLRTRTRSRPTRARKPLDKPVQTAGPTAPSDAMTGTLQVQPSQTAPHSPHAAPQPRDSAPLAQQAAPQPRELSEQLVHDVGAVAPPAPILELNAAIGSALTSGPLVSPADQGSVDTAMARQLLAELLAFMQRLRASPQSTEKGIDAAGRWATYSFNAASYAMPHIQIAPHHPRARAAPG